MASDKYRIIFLTLTRAYLERFNSLLFYLLFPAIDDQQMGIDNKDLCILFP